MSTPSPDTAALLLQAAHRVNTPAFADDDPVQFPRLYASSLEDAEIAGLLCATIAWGNRKMIVRNCGRLLALMEGRPLQYTLSGTWEDLPDDLNIHRTYFARNLKHMLRGLRALYRTWGSIDALSRHTAAADAWDVARALAGVLADANAGAADPRCLPTGLATTALKRINMWLRWMVRRDGIVDLGLWTSLTPRQLYIPLDTHVVATARELGLLTRRSPDRRACAELTEACRRVCPDDPALLDYALFGLGMGL